MPRSDMNTYMILINENYEEPVNGNFPVVTATVLADFRESSESETEDKEEQLETVVMIFMQSFIIDLNNYVYLL